MMIEDPLVQGQQFFANGFEFVAVLGEQRVDASAEVVDIAEIAVEAIIAVGIQRDDALVAVIHHAHQ